MTKTIKEKKKVRIYNNNDNKYKIERIKEIKSIKLKHNKKYKRIRRQKKNKNVKLCLRQRLSRRT